MSGRNFNDLALLLPGITSGPQQAGNAGTSADGTRPDNVNPRIDCVLTRGISGGNVTGVDFVLGETMAEPAGYNYLTQAHGQTIQSEQQQEPLRV